MIFDQVQTDGIMNYLNFTEEHHVWSTNYDIVNLCDNGWRKVKHFTYEIALQIVKFMSKKLVLCCNLQHNDITKHCLP